MCVHVCYCRYEGFLEALCRLAAIKSLPTDEEIAEKGCRDAGEYVLMMKRDDATRPEFEQMLRNRRIGWGGKLSQPLDRCVAHTLSILVRSIEDSIYRDTSAAATGADGVLNSQEVERWLRGIKVAS